MRITHRLDSSPQKGILVGVAAVEKTKPSKTAMWEKCAHSQGFGILGPGPGCAGRVANREPGSYMLCVHRQVISPIYECSLARGLHIISGLKSRLGFVAVE